MTTLVQARDAIVTYLHPAWVSAYPSVAVYYEDTTQVALDLVGDSFLLVSINFTDAIRQEIDAAPHTRIWGNVNLRLFAKEGSGTRKSLAMFDTLTSLMKYQQLSGVMLDAPTPGKVQKRDGWSSRDLNVPFSMFS